MQKNFKCTCNFLVQWYLIKDITSYFITSLTGVANGLAISFCMILEWPGI